VLRLVFFHATRLIGLGLVIGLFADVALGRLVETLLFGVEPHDAFTYAGVIGMLTAAALVAAWLPARRAARMEPITALRVE
jgi:putative ABC transport system permease protein